MKLTKSSHWIVGLLISALLSACSTLPEPAPAPPAEPIRWGLALGGGAARGFAHVGVIQALEEAGLKPHAIVGTSAGSVVGVLYASGKSAAQLRQLATQLDEDTLTDWTLPFGNRAFLRGEALAKYVNEQIKGKTLEELPIRMGVVSTDLGSGLPIVFERGDAGTAVRASSAVPGVFSPVKIGTREYVDGGLAAPVPVLQTKRMGVDKVIAVNISSPPSSESPPDILRLLLQTFAIMGQSINTWSLPQADWVITPQLQGISGTDFAAREKAIQAGYLATKAVLPQLMAMLKPTGEKPAVSSELANNSPQR
jgi:NTE family protein